MAIPQALGILSAILQGGGGIAGALGFGEQAPQQVNPYTDQVMAQLQEALQSAMGDYQSGLSASQRAQGDVRGSEREAGRIGQQVESLEQPGAMDWYDNWLGAVPGYQEIAGNLADRATEDLGRSIDEQIQLDTQTAVRQAQDQFAGSRGGAGQAALGQAIAAPMAAGRTNLLNTRAGIESGTFNQLAGQGAGLSAQGTQNEFSNALQTLMSALGAQGQIGASASGRAGQALQGAGIGAQLAGQFSGQRASLADPIYVEQENRLAPLLTGLGGAFSTLGDKSYGFPWTGSQDTKTVNPFSPAPSVPSFQGYTNSPTNFWNTMNPQFSPPFQRQALPDWYNSAPANFSIPGLTG